MEYFGEASSKIIVEEAVKETSPNSSLSFIIAVIVILIVCFLIFRKKN